MPNKPFLGPKRRLFQWTFSLLILLLPWLKIDNTSLLRIDIPSLSLHLFGATLRIEELYLLLIFSLAFVLFFLLTTLVSGRVWCGWACPQTTLSDLSEWAARRLRLTIKGYKIQGSVGRKISWHLLLMILALLVGSNLLWFFIEPRNYFMQILSGQLHPVALGTLLIIAASIYLDMAFLRRTICRDFCPYGRFQSVLIDASTLALQLPESEAPRCIKCGACVRACPMEIDIRQGYQIECINCGRCLDACRQVMHKRQQPGLIGYHFGIDGKSWRALLNPRTLLLSFALCAISLLLIVAVKTRAEATLKIALSHQVSSRRLADGTLASFFNAWLNNRTTHAESYDLSARSIKHEEFTLKGPTQKIILQGGENRKIDFVLITPYNAAESRISFVLTNKAGRPLAESSVLITPNQSR